MLRGWAFLFSLLLSPNILKGVSSASSSSSGTTEETAAITPRHVVYGIRSPSQDNHPIQSPSSSSASEGCECQFSGCYHVGRSTSTASDQAGGARQGRRRQRRSKLVKNCSQCPGTCSFLCDCGFASPILLQRDFLSSSR